MPTSLGETLLFLNSHTILISRAPKSWSFGFLTLEADLSWRRLGVRKLMSMRIFFFFAFCNHLLHLPREVLVFLSPCWHHLQSLAIFFHLWRVCWLHLDSTGGDLDNGVFASVLLYSCKMPTKCKNSLCWLMKSRAPWYILNLAMSSVFSPSSVSSYVLGSIILGNSSSNQEFWRSLFLLGFEWDWTNQHCWEETFLQTF